jgi:uncharacterized protein
MAGMAIRHSLAMRKRLKYFSDHVTRLVAALFLSSWLGAAAVTPADYDTPVPPLDGRVTDLAHVLSTAQRTSLTELLAGFEAETHHQIAVLTLPTLSGQSIESFSLRVANSWRIGLRDWNDGIVIVVATQDHRVRIEIGRGMENYISDGSAKSIIDGAMVPLFRTGDIDGGIRAGLSKLMEEAREYRIADPHRPPDDKDAQPLRD